MVITDNSHAFWNADKQGKNQINNKKNKLYYFFSDGARHPTRTFSDIAVYGTLPPKPISYNDFCPPPNCPNCENRCNNAYIHQRDIEIRQLHFDGIRFPGISNNRSFGMFSCNSISRCYFLYFFFFLCYICVVV